jgi:hypothetical protein
MKPAHRDVLVDTLRAVVVCAVLLACLVVLQWQSYSMFNGDQALHFHHLQSVANRKGDDGKAVASCNSSSGPEGTTAAAAASTIASSSSSSSRRMPSNVGSCSQIISSGFPYLGNDIFLDYAHQIFKPGSAVNLNGPSIVFLHPQDVPAFASVVPKLQHKVVLLSNSNTDQCLPWSHGDNADSWAPHVHTILNSSMVVSW